MRPELLTVHQSDSRFKDLLWGESGLDGKIARALESIDVNSAREQVHFELIERISISPVTLIRKIFKWPSLIWSLGPLLLVLIKNSVGHAEINIGFVILNLWAVTNLHLGLGLLSDVYDHIRGLDRILPRSNHVALRSGWLTARQLNRIAWILIASATLLGLPSLLAHPRLLILLVPVLLFTLVVFFLGPVGLKYRAWSEWVVFLMFGPMLTVGYQISIGAGFDIQTVAIGVLTGWLAVLEVHYKNFASLMINQRAGFQNTIAKLGFDYGKRFIVAVAWSFLPLLLSYEFFFGDWVWFGIVLLVLSPLLYKFTVFIGTQNSPIGSGSRTAQELGHRLNLIGLTLLILQAIVNLATDVIATS